VKVINEDVTSVTTKVAVKQLRYIPIMPRLKQLFMCEETAQQMRWHKEGIRDSDDPKIMLHPTDADAWHAPDRVHLGLLIDGFEPYNSDSTTYSCWKS
jgi:hypothetical protein